MTNKYTFLPWLRKGLSNQISQPATTSSRAQVTATVDLTDGQRTAPSVTQIFELTGPGDITGIDPDAIIRVEPSNWTTDFEPNYLPFVEFYDEDFAWRYTPRGPQGVGLNKMIPWLTLLVLKVDEFSRNRYPGRPLTSVIINTADPTDLFPPSGQSWAWAHTQIVGNLGNGDVPDPTALTSAIENTPDTGLCRIVSPRKLDPETAYHAFVIPTFEVGRRAGLGLSFDDETSSGLALSWTGAAEFPIYHEWYFRTGERGDFEELARRLIPRDIDPKVGIRDMDVSDPNFGMAALPAGSTDAIVGLEGALRSPQTVSQPHRPASSFASDVAAIVNQPAIAESTGDADPIVAPPIYGRWHALVNRVDPSPTRRGWVNGLNRDARFRAAAGLGAEVIRRSQETFMKRAWEQVGDILEANRKILLAQAAMLANKKLLKKTLEANLEPAVVLAIAGNLSKRVLGQERTIRADLNESLVTSATMTGQMRKLTRTRGVVERRLAGGVIKTGTSKTPRISDITNQLNDKVITTASRPDEITVVTFEDGIRFLINLDNSSPVQPISQPGSTLPLRASGGSVSRRIGARRARSGSRFGLPSSPSDLTATGRLPGLLPGRTENLTDLNFDLDIVDVIARGAIGKIPGGFAFDHDQIVNTAPPTDFRITAPPGSRVIAQDAPVLGQIRRIQLQKAMGAFANLLNVSLPEPAVRPAMDTVQAKARFIEALQPESAFRRRLDRVVDLGPGLRLDHFHGGLVDTTRERIIPAMACPDFKDPMFKYLNRLGDEFLVPNLGLVPPNTISLMLTNPAFIESYMVGLNHEFSSELLFREYPTDQRCSAFRQFWDVTSIPKLPSVSNVDHIAAHKDILPIHTWTRTSRLGTNSPRTASTGAGTVEPRVVLVIRGDLLKKYPNTIIYAQSARFGIGDRENELILHDEDGSAAVSLDDTNIHFPTFKAKVAPDLHFIGFDLTLSEVSGHPDLDETRAARLSIPDDELGKYFVIQEVVGEARFGLDVSVPDQPSDAKWDNLAWPNIDLSGGPTVDVSRDFRSQVMGADSTGTIWGSNSADMASILYQKPAMLAIHGRDMLKDL